MKENIFFLYKPYNHFAACWLMLHIELPLIAVAIQKSGHGGKSENLHSTKLGNIKEDILHKHTYTHAHTNNFHDLHFYFLISQTQHASLIQEV